MTISAWIISIIMAIGVASFSILLINDVYKNTSKILIGLIAIILIAAPFLSFKWYYANTASGQRALVDQKSELTSGLERTVTVYTANGDIIAQYEGKIDIEDNDGGYVIFDFEGKRYMYYNCFVESIADIG